MNWKSWKEATRLHTLPVSSAGVVMASGYAAMDGGFRWLPALLCLVFAVLAQIASNYANEYYDYKNGSDKKGREGFRRGVTEGDISPEAMRRATFVTLALACCVGCCLIPFGGWQLIPVGALIAVFALAYSGGPVPLSRVGLGDVAVLLFFGLVPVCLTYYLQTGGVTLRVVCGSFAIGLLGVNVLIVNNYRDIDDNKETGKRTTVVRFGKKTAVIAYLVFGYIAVVLTSLVWAEEWYFVVAPAVYMVMHHATWNKIRHSSGAALNPLLGATARNMLVYTLLLTACAVLYRLILIIQIMRGDFVECAA